MPDEAEYRKKADECRQMARIATSEVHRANWLKIAEEWLKLAEAARRERKD